MSDREQETTPGRLEEGDAQRGLEHDDPEEERDRAGLEGDEGAGSEPLPDERRDDG